jgi:integrase
MAKKTKPDQRDKGAGTLEWRGRKVLHLWVRISLPDGTRPRRRLCPETCRGPECQCRAMSEAKRQELGAAASEREIARVRREMAAAAKADAEGRLTVQSFGERWTSGKLFETHGDVNKLKIKSTARDDRYRLAKYVYPVIGSIPVASVTEQDIERVLAAAGRKGKGKTGGPWRGKLHLYQVLRRMFALAIRPGRLRETNPVQDWMRPSTGAPKLFGFLYPSECLALLRCPAIPVARRVLYALAVYTGLRKGSLYALKWSGIDFANGTITSLRSKTGLPQMFEADPSLVKLLALWHEHRGQPKGESAVVPEALVDVVEEREAETLRADLEAAGVTRSVLFGGDPAIQALRFHDLRATFVTWALRAGKGDGWISDRTGHLTTEMIRRYSRAARALEDLHFDPFPDVSRAVPELLGTGAKVVRLDSARGRN